MRVITLIGLLCLLLVGCEQKENNANLLLRQADSLMESQPDSALALLQTIPSPHKLKGREQADYCLLLTQAEYKNYLPFTSDSLLTIAIDYYQTVNDKASLGEAFYYEGCFYNEQKEYIRAAEQYKRAETLLKKTNDNVMLALLYNAMGHLNRKSDLKEEALQQFKKALYYSERSGQVYHIAMNMQEMANSYLAFDKSDSAGIYFARIVPYLDQCNEPKMATLFHNMGVYCGNYANLDLAEKYVLKSLELEKGTSNRLISYYALARIYRRQGHIAASDSLWGAVVDGMTDVRRKGGVYRDLFEQSVTEKDYKKAVSYATEQMLCMDSVYRSSIAKDVAEVQAKYDNEVLLRKSAEQKTENLILWVCILGVIFVGTGTIYLIIYSHKKYRIKKERELSSSIAKYQRELNGLEEKHSVSEEESEKLALLIKEKEEQIEQLQRKVKSDKEVGGQSIVLEGLAIDVSLKKRLREGENFHIDVAQFKAFIAYYDKLNPEFVEALKKCGLTDYEIMICLLFSISLSHKQVCEVLCRTSVTLSRVKLRLKDKIKKSNDKDALEQISSFVDLNL